MPQKKPNRTLLVILVSVAGVLALCVVAGVIGAFLGGDDKPVATDSAAAGAGMPPTPNAEAWAAYISGLKKIDPAIVGDKDEKSIVDRGRNQCSSIKEWPNDQAKLVDLTNKRFTSPTHPEGFGAAKAEQILVLVRQYICPTY